MQVMMSQVLLKQDDAYDLTAALTFVAVNFSFGIQEKYHNEGMSAAGTDSVFYRDSVVGIAYAINDEFSVSYNEYKSDRHNVAAQNVEQETTAINVGYTVGGLTIGLQDASQTMLILLKTQKSTRTIGIAVAF